MRTIVWKWGRFVCGRKTFNFAQFELSQVVNIEYIYYKVGRPALRKFNEAHQKPCDQSYECMFSFRVAKKIV